jgi:hypothetical protein
MYGSSALKAFVTFAGFLLPALLIFLAVSLLARVVRGRSAGRPEELARRVRDLEAEVVNLRRRLEEVTARSGKA